MRICSIPLGLAAAFVPALADSPPAVTLVAAHAAVSVQPVAEGQRLIRLPALDYTITVNADCGELLHAHSATVSIADTTVSLDTEALADPNVTVQLTVPGEQVAPVAVEGFCNADESAPGETGETRIDDAVTAHLSLRCGVEEQQAMIYASKPLGVALACTRDQAPSDAR